MKRLRYEWSDEIWLLHVDVTNTVGSNKSVVYSRILGQAGDDNEAVRMVLKTGENRRFIISRKTGDEIGVDIGFDDGILMKIFRLQDRAYFPGDSDMIFSNEEKHENHLF